MKNHGGMISTGKRIRPPELYSNPTTELSTSKAGETGEGKF
jgi:hypothetical protein